MGFLKDTLNFEGASVELGAGWVPEMLQRLDYVVKTWNRVDKNLEDIKRKPSEQLKEQMAFTPYAHEDVGIIDGCFKSRTLPFL